MPAIPPLGTKVTFAGCEWEIVSTATQNWLLQRTQGNQTTRTCLPAAKVQELLATTKAP